MIKKLLITALFITQFATASPLSDSALRMIKIGNEVGSPAVVKNGQDLLIKGMFELNDFDAAYEASKQTRSGNQIMGYPPQVQIANKILSKLLNQGYEPAIYDSALYLLDGDSGFVKDALMALNLLEKSTQIYSNPQSAFVAAVIRNESLAPIIKDKQRIDELITFAILNNVKGAAEYQAQYIDNKAQKLKVKNWRAWIDRQ
ncbi:hypothetical protein AZO1586I_2630 [Bathymodiolus thermophilus thioautotrophic gill symbiont]|jgi:uncharacterized phosphosugar-binding protein|uniref:Secreted protein n=3 Tax=sulfur-oxidizing symbionts TaxID=32036 RepID=A0A1H6JIP6_9GAMM|nr:MULTISPECIES: hypothetical protein [sulfur-oxidizing symbionts]CAC9532021.1 hypothetical protein [uncultured Gammaproteobacteria bacterium]CAB5503897.1 hypothetical protein AZO1586R_1668 [Bathymodiolus azoricus thioautotrophic gill symbiont]CAB5508355.1 hypothetical protein AZO1586I_2630 [Bathymodiolus thermophilus thioautotrophic gill symbiont]CAC9537222.1 hypothetical protein [uncultured Gammaproteobacteria bacterium]CAC9547820.1 hypothetical protein [uncultured Gammaproteobacteria bacter